MVSSFYSFLEPGQAQILSQVRAFVGFCLVPVFGYPASCFASPAACVAADAFLIPSYLCIMKRLREKQGKSEAGNV